MAGLYIHIPFCLRKCGYCDFYSVEGIDLLPSFMDALCCEIALRGRPEAGALNIETIYFGGGTPSLLTADQISNLFHWFRSHFDIANEPEATLEANPCTLSEESLQGYLENGINRISIGVQSFRDKELLLLGRLHSSKQAEEALMLARKAGFKQTGIDLICGLPGQSVSSHEANLNKAVSLEPDHISVYALTWNSTTPLGKKIESGAYSRPLEKRIRDILIKTHQTLTDAGYEHYEISNFAKPGFRCRHNEGYWTGEDYIGLGPSAHSYLNNERYWNNADISKYISVLSQNKLPVKEREVLSSEQQHLEQIYLGLRRKEGIPLDLIRDQEKTIAVLVNGGFANVANNRLSLTPRGFCLADEVTLQLLNEEASISKRDGGPKKSLL